MEQQHTVEMLKALADESRLSIVRKLVQADEPVTSCDIVAQCQSLASLSQPAASHHFSKLVRSGIVRETKRGTQKVYELNRALLADIGVDGSKL